MKNEAGIHFPWGPYFMWHRHWFFAKSIPWQSAEVVHCSSSLDIFPLGITEHVRRNPVDVTSIQECTNCPYTSQGSEGHEVHWLSRIHSSSTRAVNIVLRDYQNVLVIFSVGKSQPFPSSTIIYADKRLRCSQRYHPLAPPTAVANFLLQRTI